MVEVKLLCKLLPAGGYRGQIVVDGAPDPVLPVLIPELARICAAFGLRRETSMVWLP